MPDLADLFPGYESRWVETSDGRIFARVSDGGGPPLLLLHGHPQSKVMWHDTGLTALRANPPVTTKAYKNAASQKAGGGSTWEALSAGRF